MPLRFGEDEFLHLGIPAPCLVTKVYAGFQEIFDSNLGQIDTSLFNVLYLRFGHPPGKPPKSGTDPGGRENVCDRKSKFYRLEN